MSPDVALVSPYPPAGQRHGGHSGVASYAANLARSLSAEGLRVRVVAPRLAGDPDRFADGPVDVERCFDGGPSALPTALAAAAGTGAGVTHLHWELFLYGGATALAGLAPALHRRRRHGPSLVTTMHQVVDPLTVDRAYARLHRVSAPAAVARAGIRAVQSALVHASAATIVHEAAFAGTLGQPVVIPHGIESPARLCRDLARRRLGLGDAFVVLSFGFLAPYKGIELALAATAIAGPPVQLVVAGGEHPRLAAAGRAYAQELRRSGPHARFTGYVADADVACWFAAADVALLLYPDPFASSGPLALALGHGTPVLLSPALARCSGAPRALQVPLDRDAVARRLRELAADRTSLDELARGTTTLATGRRWSEVARATADVYEGVCDGHRAAGRRLRAA